MIVARVRIAARRPRRCTLFANTLVDLDLELPCTSFAEGATVDATVRATAAGDVTAAGGSLELVRTITYRYTAWSPYAAPFTATARAAEVVSRASFQLDGPLAAGRPLVRPLTLVVPVNGPGSAHTELVEIDWAVHARLRIDQGRDVEATTPIRVLPRRGTAPPSPTSPRRSRTRAPPWSGSSRCRAAGWSRTSRCPVC